jgi:hypothetical protein
MTENSREFPLEGQVSADITGVDEERIHKKGSTFRQSQLNFYEFYCLLRISTSSGNEIYTRRKKV